MAEELPATPPPPATGAEAAEAAIKAVIEQQHQAEQKKVADSEVIDPDARPQRYTQRPTSPDEEPAAKAPKLVDGASTSEPRETNDPLIDRALALDIPIEDAQAMSAQTLRKLVVKLERRSEPPTPRQAQQAAEQAIEKEEFSLPPIESGDPEVEVLPGLKSGIDKRDQVMTAQQRRIEELEKRDEARDYNERVREQKTAERTFGRQIAADADLHDDLGSEVGHPDDPAQMKAREELWVYYSTAINSGKEPDDAYKIARRAVYGDKLADVEGKKLSDKAEAQAKRFSRPPAGGRPKEMPFGKERAVAELESKLNRK